MPSGGTRYRQAYNAGAQGRGLSDGLASLADADPLIDSAHDAGRAGTPYEQWQGANGQGRPASAPGPAKGSSGARGGRGGSGKRGSKGYSGRSGSGNLGIRRSARNASVANPTGGALPVGLTAGAGAAGLFFGAIAYALILSVVDYGPSGPLLWFKAKFLNEAAGSSAPASSGSSSGTSGPVAIPPPGTPFKATAPGVAFPVTSTPGAAA